MGSIVTLGLGHLEIDWGKNWSYRNHSRLFLPSDRTPVTHHYVDEDGESVIEQLRPGFARSLRSVKRRVELLGYTLSEARSHFENEEAPAPDYYEKPDIGFDVLARALASVDVQAVGLDPSFADHSLGDFAARSILGDPEFAKTLENLKSLTRFDGTFFENLDPYVVLRLLAENPANLDIPVEWRIADIVEGGWADDAHIYEGLSDRDRYLIVTEGSSDGAVIRRAMELLHPDISDFFDFVDMSENFPFTGAGNLFRFCQGLARIKIQNKVVVIFDNDVAGREAEQKVLQLDLPANMIIVRLPDIPKYKTFPTVGPNGQADEDINGRAVSTELFLDLRSGPQPRVRWTAYNASMQCYQGELVEKELYAKQFIRLRALPPDYDCSKLELLIDHLYGAIIGAANKGAAGNRHRASQF
jgi:hypothetical protein